MEFAINQTPFKMAEVAAKLSNQQYLSDVTFIVDCKPIYAHSLVLMVRSNVFQKQLESTLGEKKIIPITGYGYDAFYQLIRFIYTDQYTGRDNREELLKLAKVYNVIRLLNELINERGFLLDSLNLGVVENHQIGLNSIKVDIANQLAWYMNSVKFLSIHQNTLEVILKFDQIANDVNELDILDALVRWMQHHSTQNQIELSECRQKFNKLIRLIRLPTLSNEELHEIKTKYPDLLTKSDFANIAGQKIYGDNFSYGIWNCRPRLEFKWLYSFTPYTELSITKTKFSVSTEIIFGGFVFGHNFGLINSFNFTITCQYLELDETVQTNINELGGNHCFSVIRLGASIRLRPNIIYTLSIERTNFKNQLKFYCRKPDTELIINAPPNSVNILEAHETMFELMFFKPEDV